MIIYAHYKSPLFLLIPKRFTAIAIGNHIFFRRSFTSTALMAHEVCHCFQYEKYGFFGFLFKYLWLTYKHGYDFNPLELEADTYAYEKHMHFSTIVSECFPMFHVVRLP